MTDASGLRPVELLGVPLELHRRGSEHGEALRRELAFVEHAADPAGAPARLHVLGQSLAERYGGLTAAQAGELERAAAAGEATVDLHYDLPVEVADACDELERLLEELDQFCRDGDLLTLVTPPELVAYRQWFLGEVRDQLRQARAPRPWPATGVEADPGPASEAAPGSAPASGPAAEEPAGAAAEEPAGAAAEEPAGAGGDGHGGDGDGGEGRGGDGRAARIEVDEDLDLALAPDLRDRIVAHTEAGVTSILVDLSRCAFIDSTGLSLLLTTHLRLQAEGGGLRVVGARGQVASVLQVSGLEALLVGPTG